MIEPFKILYRYMDMQVMEVYKLLHTDKSWLWQANGPVLDLQYSMFCKNRPKMYDFKQETSLYLQNINPFTPSLVISLSLSLSVCPYICLYVVSQSTFFFIRSLSSLC